MRIPLDYYQILGVSFDATPEQIQQSFEDRIQQLPKQQYSTFAIASRKKLLQEAHGILLNPKRRQEHDQGLFPEGETPADEPVESAQPDALDKGIDVDSNYLAGALILLLEFGEFDAVLELGLAHLNRPIDLEKMPSEAGPNDDDVALAVAIAHLELGREHWQQGDCEKAGQCLKTGLKILHDEGKFLDIQAEIETDLSKLRPYRVLDLLALELDDPKRAEGLSLLQDMLDERGGMEGNGDDQSGLSVNDFLLFMQQLRDHLTVDEQFSLFKAEAMRPSSVASYLGVYAHVAKGVSEYNPTFISQAKALLSSLSDRQDLSLEQGICSLLLGQPDAAAHCAEQSTDEEAIAFISEYSEGAPDIIPGLYLYTEQWLQQEVYPYFRDLSQKTISLEDYFNDADVQRQLSDLEPDLPALDNSWNANDVDAKWQQWLEETTQDDPGEADRTATDQSKDVASSSSATDNITESKTGNWFSAFSASKTDETVVEASAPLKESADLKWQQSPLGESTIEPAVKPVNPPQKISDASKRSGRSASPSRPKDPEVSVKSPLKTASSSSNRKPWMIWAASLLLGISVVWGAIAIGKLFQAPPTASEESVDTPAAPTQPETPPTPPEQSPEATEQPDTAAADDGTLAESAAQEIIQVWQKVKADALGESHQVDQLSQILIEPALSRWRYSADIAADEGKYTKYNLKTLKVNSVTMDSPTEALVRATIEEVRDQYSAGGSEPFASLDDAYQVDYRLESIDGKWRIKEMKVVDE